MDGGSIRCLSLSTLQLLSNFSKILGHFEQSISSMSPILPPSDDDLVLWFPNLALQFQCFINDRQYDFQFKLLLLAYANCRESVISSCQIVVQMWFNFTDE